MLYLFGMVLGIGFGVSVAVIGAGIGQGLVGMGAMQAMARQPENTGRIQIGMIIALALIESLVIYALLMVLILTFLKLPNQQQAIELIKAGLTWPSRSSHPSVRRSWRSRAGR